MKSIVAGIEAGGTKCICAIGSGPEDIRAEIRVPTTDPQTTTRELIHFIKEYEQTSEKIAALGIACFGPLDLSPTSADLWLYHVDAKAGVAEHADAEAVPRRVAGAGNHRY